ncbi:hypothetical protein [Psychromonas ossibalaenae]|uniref:hypothetical protein n=1 Tax=Psychromonas ossibalaenae TaxID=444922 RepID=UPI000376DA7D|nr:hypothetical protein [Psychromonas ossibalaenae]
MIRSTEQFKKDAYRGTGHVKSKELKDVFKKLQLHHSRSAVCSALSNHLLIDLRDSVINWSIKHPKEFASRHGPELAHEVMAELTLSSAEHLQLRDGDILFRWVPRGIDQRGALQTTISAAQDLQDFRHRQLPNQEINIGCSTMVLQHVGIYSNGSVIEIGSMGLVKTPVHKREHYDLVLRSRHYGPRIAETAEKAKSARFGLRDHKIDFLVKYPVWDLATVAIIPHAGSVLLGPVSASGQPQVQTKTQFDLQSDDRRHQKKGQSNVLQQRVVCSHFVNAVLYASVKQEGTLAAATMHAHDKIFKIGPAQMWKEFMEKQGLWGLLGAFFVGVQHKGRLDRNIDPRALGVGLKMPAVPKKAGRPPLPVRPGPQML